MNKTRLSIGIIDLDINNIFSVYRACLKAGFKTEIVNLKKCSAWQFRDNKLKAQTQDRSPID